MASLVDSLTAGLSSSSWRRRPLHSQELLQCLDDLRHDGTLCDVILSAGDVHVRAHRVVLAGNSSYFKAMFSSSLSEKHRECIELHCIEPGALSQLIDFIYTGQIEVTQGNVLELLPAARLLQVAGVEEECCGFLEEQLHVSNCVGVARYAEVHACDHLLTAARLYMCRHFTEVVSHSEEFLQISDPDEIKEIICSDNLVVDSEEFVYDAIERWINVDPGMREKHFIELLKCVRFPYLNLRFIKCEMEERIRGRRRAKRRSGGGGNGGLTNGLTNGLSDIDQSTLEKIYQDAIDYKTQGDKRLCCGEVIAPTNNDNSTSNNSITAVVAVSGTDCDYLFKTTPRQPARRICAVAGKNGLFATLNSVDCFDPSTNSWSPMPCVTRNRFECGVATLHGHMYVVGGMVLDMSDPPCHQHETSVEMWDEETAVWADSVPMRHARSALGAVAMCGHVYAIGGYDGEQYLRSMERYSPYTKRWESCAPMEEARSCFSAASLEDTCIYAMGGYSPPCLHSVERYDLETDTWRRVASMREKRINFGCASLCGFIYVVGGHNGVAYLSTVERYDPHTDQWTAVTSMGQPRTGLGVCVVGHHLYAIGGHSGALYLKTAQRYNARGDTWEPVREMVTSRCSFGLTSI